MLEINNKNEAAYLFTTIENGKPSYKKLNKPAVIVNYCVLFIANHTPNVECVFNFNPEDFFPKPDTEDMTQGEWGEDWGFDVYKERCEEFSREYEEACKEDNTQMMLARKSLNRGDLKFATQVRVTDEYVDAQMATCHSFFRIPKQNVVILTPDFLSSQDENEEGVAALRAYTILLK